MLGIMKCDGSNLRLLGKKEGWGEVVWMPAILAHQTEVTLHNQSISK